MLDSLEKFALIVIVAIVCVGPIVAIIFGVNNWSKEKKRKVSGLVATILCPILASACFFLSYLDTWRWTFISAECMILLYFFSSYRHKLTERIVLMVILLPFVMAAIIATSAILGGFFAYVMVDSFFHEHENKVKMKESMEEIEERREEIGSVIK